MNLPPPRPQYDPNNEGQMRAELAREDTRNVKITDYATTTKRGVVKADGTTVAVATDGTISAVAGASGINQLTGDVMAGPGAGSVAATLSASGVMAGTYGDATHVGQYTVDAKGRITGAASVAITQPAGANPSATASDVAVNGAAATFMRSDAAPAIQKASPSQYGLAKADGTTITDNGSGVFSAVGSGAGGGGGTGWFSPTMQRMAYVFVNNSALAAVGDTVVAVGTAGGGGASGAVPIWGITPASTATASGLGGQNAYYSTGQNINAFFNAGINQTTNIRSWVGLTDSALATQVGSDNPATKYVAFRFSSSAGDAHWQACVSDGTQVVVDTGVAPNTSTTQRFGIIATTTSVKFYIDGALVATITTHIPGAATFMAWDLSIIPITSTGAKLKVSYFYIFQDNIG